MNESGRGRDKKKEGGRNRLETLFFRLGKKRREGDREERKRIREAEQAPPINHYFFPFPPPFLLLFSVQEMYTLCCTDCTVAMRAISYKGYKLDKAFSRLFWLFAATGDHRQKAFRAHNTTNSFMKLCLSVPIFLHPLTTHIPFLPLPIFSPHKNREGMRQRGALVALLFRLPGKGKREEVGPGFRLIELFFFPSGKRGTRDFTILTRWEGERGGGKG